MRNMKSINRGTPTISTASLPDIVFILLFFFMTVTTMKNKTLLVDNSLPNASEVKSLDKKDRVIEIFVGKPSAELAKVFGSEPKIQLDNKLARVDEVGTYILSELAKKPESIRNLVTVSLKIDKEVQLGIVSDIKEELRKVNQLKVNYTTLWANALPNN